MPSLNYNKIYSRFFGKVEAYDFLDLKESDVYDLLASWLHSSAANQYVSRLFTSLKLDDLIQEMSYEMKYSVDDYRDEEFVVEILAIGMAIAWLEPKVNSMTNIAQMFGSKEEKLRGFC